MSRPSRQLLCYGVFAVGVMASAVAPMLMRWSSDIGSARRVISRHLLTQEFLAPGVETTTDLLHPAATGWLLLEVELTMNRDDLTPAGPWGRRTPFDWEYDFRTEHGRQVYSGYGGSLTVLQKPVERVGPPARNMVRVIGREVVHRVGDAGPVVVRARLSAPSSSSFEDAVLRVYDELDTSYARRVDRVTWLLLMSAPFAMILGFASFVLVTRSHRTSDRVASPT